jgi:hypothetical protein
MNTVKFPIYKKGATRYALTPEGAALPLIRRKPTSGWYRNSKKPIPSHMPHGYYLGKPSKVDQTEIDFVEVGTFEKLEGWTRLV